MFLLYPAILQNSLTSQVILVDPWVFIHIMLFVQMQSFVSVFLNLNPYFFFFFFTEMGRTSSIMLIEMVTLLVLFSISKAVVGQDDLLSAFQPQNFDFPHDHVLSG